MTVPRLIGAIAIAIAAFFAGAAVIISVAEQPARLMLTEGALLTQWKASYAAALPLQGTLAILGGVAGALAWWRARNWRWLLGAGLMLANWPYTLIAIMPINDALNAMPAGAAGPEIRPLVERWGTVHALRGGLGLLAVLTFPWALAVERREP
ncbi:MAG: DUF1772 domain-containing protein [Alphaproteobacteria bacterium]|nr:DUF1772 domain-containing protein [Alphaproteobacteria bacterium]